MIRNTDTRYGLSAVVLHWVMAMMVFGLFSLGLYMTSLGYYDPWYHSAPWWHKSGGLLLLCLLIIRAAWALFNIKPVPLPTHQPWETLLATIVHRLLYWLLLAICVSGFLIATAKGDGIEFFGWFEVSAITNGLSDQEDLTGKVHLVLAITTMLLAALHVAGALKHHFLDRDTTLKRMFGI